MPLTHKHTTPPTNDDNGGQHEAHTSLHRQDSWGESMEGKSPVDREKPVLHQLLRRQLLGSRLHSSCFTQCFTRIRFSTVSSECLSVSEQYSSAFFTLLSSQYSSVLFTAFSSQYSSPPSSLIRTSSQGSPFGVCSSSSSHFSACVEDCPVHRINSPTSNRSIFSVTSRYFLVVLDMADQLTEEQIAGKSVVSRRERYESIDLQTRMMT